MESTTGRREPMVLFLGHGAERTGPPILLATLLDGLAGRPGLRWSVVVERDGPLTGRYGATSAAVRAVTAGREPLELPTAALRRLRAAPLAARVQHARRRRVVRSVPRPDLVYVNAATTATARLLRALDPPHTTPVLLHVHELDVALRDGLAAPDRDLLLGRADLVLAVSDAVTDVLVNGHGIEPGRVVTCPGFVDLGEIRPLSRPAARRRLGIPADARVVGSVGLPDWRKDPEHLLRAVALTDLRADDRVRIVWVGGDPTSDDGRRLANEARRLGLADRFLHVAHREDATALLGAFDVFVLPAREDAMPLAALEAAAAALPIVTFDSGGTAALCRDGAGVVAPYPDARSMGNAIVGLLDDPESAAQAGRVGRALVERRHSSSVGVERIDRAMRLLLERSGTSD